MSKIGERIVELQKELEERKQSKARHEGAERTVKDKLKNHYACTNLKEAKEKVLAMQNNLEKEKKTLNKLLDKFEKNYNI